MWAKILFAAFAFTVAGCGSNSSKQSVTTTDTLADGTVVERKLENSTNENSTSESGFWERLVMVEIKDKNGMVAAIRPFPASWKLIGGSDAAVTGPNGMQIRDLPLQIFMINYNQNIQRGYDMAGTQMRQMPGVEQLIQEDLVPWAQNQGMQLVQFYEISEISKMDQWYMDLIVQGDAKPLRKCSHRHRLEKE